MKLEGHRREICQISIGIPAYSRCSELRELLQSIYQQTVLPAEITICEDMSPERSQIRMIVEYWREKFNAFSCRINYRENERNLGYDANLRRVISVSSEPSVMLMGNDDILLPGCIEKAAHFIQQNPKIQMISRSFMIFQSDSKRIEGISQFSPNDQVLNFKNSSSKLMFRACGFVGGLIVQRGWAESLATSRYDGSLYYQVYLAANAFCEGGIGYISKTIVGSRAGNPPLFGSATQEKDVHVPGSYTPKGRAKMWASVLQIAKDVGDQAGVDLYKGVRYELEVRQSFHIFEMMAGAGRQKLVALRDELKALDLFSHPVPRTLYVIDLILGSRAKVVFRAIRKVHQFGKFQIRHNNT